MKSLTVISLIRHGDVANPQDVFYGRLPRFRLSEEGMLHAQTASQTLQGKKITAIFSSPLLRARQTATILLLTHPQVPLHISKLLNEVYTPFDGVPISKVIARQWDIYTGTPAPYEQPNNVLSRALAFVTRVRERFVGQHIVAVTHGDLIAFLILWAKVRPITPEEKRDLRLLGFLDEYPAPASICNFIFQPATLNELPSVEYMNLAQ